MSEAGQQHHAKLSEVTNILIQKYYLNDRTLGIVLDLCMRSMQFTRPVSDPLDDRSYPPEDMGR